MKDQTLIDELQESVQSLSRRILDKDMECKRNESVIKELEETNQDIRDRLLRRSEECDR